MDLGQILRRITVALVQAAGLDSPMSPGTLWSHGRTNVTEISLDLEKWLDIQLHTLLRSIMTWTLRKHRIFSTCSLLEMLFFQSSDERIHVFIFYVLLNSLTSATRLGICTHNHNAWRHGRPQGGAKRAFAPLEIEPKEPKFYRKYEVSSLISIIWFHSCNDSLFAGKTLTLHKSQVHGTGVMQ